MPMRAWETGIHVPSEAAETAAGGLALGGRHAYYLRDLHKFSDAQDPKALVDLRQAIARQDWPAALRRFDELTLLARSMGAHTLVQCIGRLAHSVHARQVDDLNDELLQLEAALRGVLAGIARLRVARAR